MADINDVMDGLEKCAGAECNDKCPYNSINYGCRSKLMLDARELLKAQRKVIRDLCALGYPHNFQHEAPWVAQYCRDVSGVITEAFEVNDIDTQD